MVEQHESELLSAYIDRELTGEELAHVQQHLATSAEWRKELERLQKTKNITLALPPVAVPEDLIESLEAQANEHFRQKRFSLKNLLPALPKFFDNMWMWGSTFASAAALIIGIGLYRNHQNAYIPLEPLVAVHTQSNYGSLFHQNVIAASIDSSGLKKHELK